MAQELKYWFDKDFFEDLGHAIARQYPGFDERSFLRMAMDGLDRLELMQRMTRTVEACRTHLPDDYSRAVGILKAVAPRYEGKFQGLFCSEYVGRYGLDDFDYSLDTLAYFTTFSSAEFGVREFLLKDFDRTLEVMKTWAASDNHNHRRLASEGSRPRLPWSFRIPQLIRDPSPTRPILERLNTDESETVRRSVANHLNDISKDHPEIMLDWVEAWDRTDERTGWIVKHAARGLLKKGHPRAFGLFGFEAEPDIEAVSLTVDKPAVAIGDDIGFSVTLKSLKQRSQKLAVDFAVHYMKKNGKTSPKVFKLKEFELGPGATEGLGRRISFQNLSTREHHPGTHHIELIVNGRSAGMVSFDVTD